MPGVPDVPDVPVRDTPHTAVVAQEDSGPGAEPAPPPAHDDTGADVTAETGDAGARDEEARPPRAAGLGTRLVALGLGLGLLAGIALLQRFAEPGRPLATTQRERKDVPPPRVEGTTALAPTPNPTPDPTPEALEGPVSLADACKPRTQRDLRRHYSFERSRVGLWFRRLERYNDHRLRIDEDSSGHAQRGAVIDRSRSSRWATLDDKLQAASQACDPRLLF